MIYYKNKYISEACAQTFGVRRGGGGGSVQGRARLRIIIFVL